jgi:anti-sigma B factor antagonist
MMEVSSRREGDVLVLSLKGKLIGEPYSIKFTEAIKSAVDAGDNKVVMDFSAVDWINSTGISMLMAARETLQHAHAKMRLSAINQSVTGVFAVSKMHLVFEIHPTTEAAIKSFV